MSIAKPDRRGRKRLRTAEHLSATAFKLFESQGYDSVSMEQIANEADVARATLYSHFPVKEALIAHRFREEIAAGMAERATALSAHKSFDARMRYLLRESATWHTARRDYLPHYLRYLTSRADYGQEMPRDKPYASGTREILTLMFKAAQESGEISLRQPAAQVAGSFEYLLFGAVTAWLTEPGKDLTERFLDAFDLTMHGVATSRRTTRSRSVAAGIKRK